MSSNLPSQFFFLIHVKSRGDTFVYNTNVFMNGKMRGYFCKFTIIVRELSCTRFLWALKIRRHGWVWSLDWVYGGCRALNSNGEKGWFYVLIPMWVTMFVIETESLMLVCFFAFSPSILFRPFGVVYVCITRSCLFNWKASFFYIYLSDNSLFGSKIK